jgi:hypothetical protein
MERSPVFVSWSGSASRKVAESLREWLPKVLQSVHPFVSSKDVAAGAVWFDSVAEQLRRSKFAIICVTPDNLDSTWLHFEAGAIGMAVPEGTSVVPYLLGVKTTDLKPPLSFYQAQPADTDGTRKLLTAINRGASIPVESLDETFDVWWPLLESQLEAARSEVTEPGTFAQRSERDLLEEILEVTRTMARAIPMSRPGDDAPQRAAQRRLELHDSLRSLAENLRTDLMGTDVDVQVFEEAGRIVAELVVLPGTDIPAGLRENVHVRAAESIPGRPVQVRIVEF